MGRLSLRLSFHCASTEYPIHRYTHLTKLTAFNALNLCSFVNNVVTFFNPLATSLKSLCVRELYPNRFPSRASKNGSYLLLLHSCLVILNKPQLRRATSPEKPFIHVPRIHYLDIESPESQLSHPLASLSRVALNPRTATSNLVKPALHR